MKSLLQQTPNRRKLGRVGWSDIFFGLRCDELSSDGAKTIDVIKDVIAKGGLKDNDLVVLLQPTSPIRSTQQITDCVNLALQAGESVVSVAELEEPHPYKLKKIDNKSGALIPFIDGTDSEQPRQSLPTVYQLTGAIYVASVSTILSVSSLFSSRTVPYVTELFVNIDTPFDYEVLKNIEYKI